MFEINWISFLKKNNLISIFFELEHFQFYFVQSRTFTQTSDLGVARCQNNDLKICRLLLLMWRATMMMNFSLLEKKNDDELLLVEGKMRMNF